MTMPKPVPGTLARGSKGPPIPSAPTRTTGVASPNWCREHGREALPADVLTMAAFVTSLAKAGKKVATIQRHCASVSKAHQLAGLPTPTDDWQFKTLLEGISREKDVKQKQAPAFTLAYFKRVVQSIDTARPDGVRDRALLLLGLAGAFRRDE